MRRKNVVLALALVAVLGSSATALARSSHAAVRPNPGDFTARADNPWLPLLPGTTYVYVGVKDGKPARDVVTVTHRTATIDGVPCVVVEDRLYLSGRLHERTIDWYSHDRKGNVWYFGEQTAELDASGNVTSTSGSFQSRVDGAEAGLFMPASPRLGQSFRQEFYEGEAEDHFQVIGLFAATTPPGTANALLTKEWTPLEPGVLDHKLYVRGTGTVVERTVKGGDELNELVAFDR